MARETNLLIDETLAGGLLCGAMAGGAARYGRLCTMAAIEDLLLGGNSRSAKAWGLAAAVAILATQALIALGSADVSASVYMSSRLHVVGTMAGGLVFGLGMTLVGTCSFGLIVRAGSGDLRAALSAVVVGITAFVATSGALSAARLYVWDLGVVTLPASRPASLGTIAALAGGRAAYVAVVLGLAGALVAMVAFDARLRQRPRLLASAIVMGLAIAGGWLITSRAVEALAMDRAESLSFVAPVGRMLLQLMVEPLQKVGFAVAALVGVCGASFVVSALRREVRLEAFDEPREMIRHLFGAALMGVGGVLAQGCTIGQGLSGLSVLATSSLLFLPMVVLGARIGLWYLVEAG